MELVCKSYGHPKICEKPLMLVTWHHQSVPRGKGDCSLLQETVRHGSIILLHVARSRRGWVDESDHETWKTSIGANNTQGCDAPYDHAQRAPLVVYIPLRFCLHFTPISLPFLSRVIFLLKSDFLRFLRIFSKL